MANDVNIKLTGDGKQLDDELKKSKDSIQGWAGSVKGVIAGLAAGFVLKKVFDVGAGLFSGMNEDEQALNRLGSALNNAGDKAGYSMEQFEQLADRAERMNGITADSYMNMSALIVSMGNVRGENIDRAIISAADLATVMGGDTASSAEKLGRALNDPLKGMKLLEKEGVVWTEQQEEMVDTMMRAGDVAGAQGVILDELSSRFGGASASATETFSGKMFVLKESLNAAGESIVGIFIPLLDAILPPIQLAIDYVGYMAKSLADNAEATAEWSQSWASYFIDGLKYGVQIAADTFSFFEYMWDNFGTLVQRSATDWALSITTFVEDLKYLFTDVATAYLNWFFDNWYNMLTDFANFQATVFGNMWKNVTSFFKGVMGWLTGEGGGFEWTGLTDGFEATTKALPEIASRNMSDTEKILQSDIDRMDKELGKAWNDTFKKNQDFVDNMFAAQEQDPPEITPTVSKEGYTVDIDKIKDETEKEKPKIKAEVETEFGKVVGLEELSNQISEGGKADKEKAREEAKKEFEKQLKDQEELAKKVKVADKNGAIAAQAGRQAQGQGQNQAAIATKPDRKNLEDLYNLLSEFNPQLLRAVEKVGALA